MNLRKKKELAAKTLDVGKSRIVFVKARLEDIKEAITKQDIRDLHKDGAIQIKEVKGRKKIVRRKRARGTGKVRKKVNTRKREYVKMVRKQRGYAKEMMKRGALGREGLKDLRKKIKNKRFKSQAHLRDYIGGLEK